MRIDFQVVKVKGSKSGKCACGKRVTRSRTFEQTINPFNKNAAGFPKGFHEIRSELLAQKEDYVKEPVICTTCKES